MNPVPLPPSGSIQNTVRLSSFALIVAGAMGAILLLLSAFNGFSTHYFTDDFCIAL